MPTVSDLITAKDSDTLFAELLATAQAEGLPTTSWQSGAVPRTLLKADATALADLHATQAAVAKAAFLDDAMGAWLTLLAAGKFQVTRSPSTYTEGYIKVTVASGAGPYTITPAGLLVTDGSRRWRSVNTTAITITSAAATNVLVRAESPGANYNVSNDTITTLVSPALAGVSVTNAAYASGTWVTSSGTAEESDASLRARCRARWATLGRGATLAAYAYWATTCPSAATVTRAKVVPGSGDGTLTIYVAQSTSVASGGQVAAVQAWVDEQKPVTDDPTVTAATAVTVQVSGSVRFSSSTYDTAAAHTTIENAITALITGKGFGDTVDLGAIYHAIYAAADGVADVDLTLPAADAVLTVSQIGAAALSLAYTT